MFNPLLVPGGALAPTLGGVVGVGPGRGIGLMMMLMGTVMILATTAAALTPAIRAVEDAPPEDAPAEPQAVRKEQESPAEEEEAVLALG